MIGKIIAHADDRDTAIIRMRTALTELVIEGIRTNTPLQLDIMQDAAFKQGGANIHYLEEKLNKARNP
jgi:acetyl-CoA carboxylase biotin carboxylase subunit